MRNPFFTLLIGLIVSTAGMAQTDPADTVKQKKEIRPCIDVAVGYLPKSDYKDLRISVAYNNWLLKRLGVFTALEYSPPDGNYTHILGLTGSLTHYLYLFGGIDIFTPRGIIQKGLDCRKSVGVGIYPWKWTVVKLGYSFNAGFTGEVGVKVPLGKKI